LGVHHTTVRKLIASGELRARRVGSVWRISPEALRDFMNGGVA
jgi:excisionase family DNA binding protein